MIQHFCGAVAHHLHILKAVFVFVAEQTNPKALVYGSKNYLSITQFN
jgi:hypothetical protein